MKEDRPKPGDTVDLIAISTGTINSTGVEGDEDDKLYRLMKYDFSFDQYGELVYTSEYQGQ